MIKKLLNLFLFFNSFVLFSAGALGYEGFVDNFDNRDTAKWNYTENSGAIIFNDGTVSLGTSLASFPLMHGRINESLFSASDDSVLEVKFKYDRINYNGSGIGIGFTGLDGKPFYEFQIWADKTSEMGNGIAFVHNNYNREGYGYCRGFYDQGYHSERTIIKLLNDSLWHVLRIERVGGKYYVYFDKDVNSIPIFVTEDNDCNPKNVWFGNPLGGGTQWSYFSVDYIKVFVDKPVVSQNKIIILPGLGASWNTQAFVYGQSVADDQWKMTPFAHNYDGLINALTKKGLVKDKDFFIWNYDWRRPASEIVNKLDTFINSNIGSSEKVDLVGHSFGGVIARIWGQDHLSNPRLGKIVTLGSPHSGTMIAYDWWNGSKSVAGADPAQVALAMVYQLNRRNTQKDIDVLRNFAPSLKDLLPTFNFIVRNNILVDSNLLTTKNDYLKSKNTGAVTVFDNLKTIIGVGQSTSEKIMVGERTVFDKVLGRWPDGAPLKYILGQGDGTVVKNSAKFDGDAFEEVMSDHGKIVDKGINNVLAELGVGGTANEPIYDLSNKWIFFIGSPAYLSVKCGNNSPVVSDELGFVVADGINNECQMNVTGTGNGTYHLVTGKTNDQNSWQYFEETIGIGQSKTLVINSNGPKIDPVNLDYFYGLVKYDLAKLRTLYPGNTNLTTAVNGANGKNINNLMLGLFNFRKEKKESLISGAIIKNLETILSTENRNLSSTVIRAAYTKAIQDKSLVDRITRLNVVMGKSPTPFGAESYKKMEEMLNQNGLQYGKSVLASKLAAEVW